MTKIQIRENIEDELTKNGYSYIIDEGCILVFCSLGGMPDAVIFEIAVFTEERVGISFNIQNPQNLTSAQVSSYISAHCPFYDRAGVTDDLEIVYLERYMTPVNFIRIFDFLITNALCFVYPYITNPDWEEYR